MFTTSPLYIFLVDFEQFISISSFCNSVFTFFLSATVFCLTTFAKENPTHWGYEGETGPEHWGDLLPEYAMAKEGNQQSPINFTEHVDGQVLEEIAPIGFSYTKQSLELENNGHALVVHCKGDACELSILGKNFSVVQFHFHTPSEHTVQGEAFPAEVHFVHKNADGKLAVVGVFLKESDSAKENGLLKTILDNAREKNIKDTIGQLVQVDDTQIDLYELLPQEDERSYFTYNGSLTTPPCTEGVLWVVMKTPIEIPSEQIAALKEIFPNPNARPVQPINDRFILEGAGSNP